MPYTKRPSGGSSGGYKGKSSFGGPRSGGFKKPGFGAPRGAGGFGDGPRELFEATCADCGKTTEVPFRPNGRKPVFCRDCFKKEENGGGGERPSFSAERPSRPSFSAERSERSAPATGGRTDVLLSEISAKLDRVVRALENLKEAVTVEEVDEDADEDKEDKA